jgi:hypothetical protein
MWQLAGSYAPGVSLLLVCLVLANSEILLMSGNLAGIAISLCVIAAWCFLRERFVLVGMLCLALSLAIKPHDAGLVWLYFLLAGGAVRKRALQTLVLTIVLALPAVLWVTHVAPQWIEELHSNLSATTAHGDLNDPGPVSISFHNANMVIDLQAAISIFRDDPRMYNPASYVICGALILAWSIHTLRTGFSTEKSLIALAAIAAFSMLPIYHREYDAKLLLLAVPACALLWAKGGLTGWLALLINSAGVILTGDIPAALLIIFCDHLHLGSASVLGKIVTVILMRPAPLILLVMGIFYMWMYLKGADPRLLTENAK